MKLKDKTAITIQIDDEDLEDIRILAHRRGQSLSELVRRSIERELAEEADRTVTS